MKLDPETTELLFVLSLLFFGITGLMAIVLSEAFR